MSENIVSRKLDEHTGDAWVLVHNKEGDPVDTVMIPPFLAEGRSEAEIIESAWRFLQAWDFANKTISLGWVRAHATESIELNGIIHIAGVDVVLALVKTYRRRAERDEQEQERGAECIRCIDGWHPRRCFDDLTAWAQEQVRERLESDRAFTEYLIRELWTHIGAWALLQFVDRRRQEMPDWDGEDLAELLRSPSKFRQLTDAFIAPTGDYKTNPMTPALGLVAIPLIRRLLSDLDFEGMSLPKLRRLICRRPKRSRAKPAAQPEAETQEPPSPQSEAAERSGDYLEIPSDLVTQSVMQAIHRSGAGWDDQNGQAAPAYRHQANEGRGAVLVSIRGGDGSAFPDAAALPALWEKVGKLDDLTSDALLVCLDQWARGPGPNEPVTITADQILDARGIRRIRRRDEPGNWQHGHRTEDRQAAGRALALLNDLWVEYRIETRNRGARRLNNYSKALAMLDVVTQEVLTGEEVFISARVMPGSWAGELAGENLRQRGLLAQKALAYDPYREAIEKRLAKWLAFHFRINARHRDNTCRVRVATLLDNAVIVLNKSDPQRTKTRLEKALRRLTNDGVIASWGYLIEAQRVPHDGSEIDRYLPPKRWGPKWQEMTIAIEPPTEIIEHYQFQPVAAGVGEKA